MAELNEKRLILFSLRFFLFIERWGCLSSPQDNPPPPKLSSDWWRTRHDKKFKQTSNLYNLFRAFARLMLRQCLAALRRRLRTLKTIILRRTPPLPRLAAKEASLSSKGGRGRHLNERLWCVCVLTKSSSDKEPMSTAAEPCWVNPAQHKGYAGSERSPSRHKKNPSILRKAILCLSEHSDVWVQPHDYQEREQGMKSSLLWW